MAQIESRLSNDHQETARLQASTQAAIENLRYEVASRPADIGPVLEQVAAMCALVAERLEADRLERRALTEAITLLARPGVLDGPSRVIGGTVMSSSEISLDAHQDAHDASGLEAIDSVPIDRAPVDARRSRTMQSTWNRLKFVPTHRRRSIPRPLRSTRRPSSISPRTTRRSPRAPPAPTEIWNQFQTGRVESADSGEELDLRPCQGTRLTAAPAGRTPERRTADTRSRHLPATLTPGIERTGVCRIAGGE